MAQSTFGNLTGPGGANPSGIPGFNSSQGLTAHAGGGQANALQLNAWVNEVAVVATANDSVMLPPGFAGARITVINDGGASMQVFGYLPAQGAGDTIAPHGSATQAATGTGVAQAAGTIADYICFSGEAGNTNNTTAALWKQFLTA